MNRSTNTRARAALVGALVAGAALIATASTPVSAVPVTPTVIAEDGGTNRFFTHVDHQDRLIFIDETGRLLRYDAAADSTTELDTGVVIDSSEDIPTVTGEFSFAGFERLPGLLFYRGTGGTFNRLDLETGVTTTLTTLAADERVGRIREHFADDTLLVRIERPSGIDSFHIFSPDATSLPAAVDTTDNGIGARADDVAGVWFFQKGTDADTEVWSMSEIGSTVLIDEPYIRSWDPVDGSIVLQFETDPPPGDVHTHWILDDATQPATPYHTDDGSRFGRIYGSERLVVFDTTVVSLDDAFPDWEITSPPTPSGYEPPRTRIQEARDGRLIVYWTFRPIGDSPPIESPVSSYPVAGGTPTELPPRPVLDAFDSTRRELPYGGIVEFVDNGDGTYTLSYTPARSTTARVIETLATNSINLEFERGFGRITYQRPDGTFVTYALEQAESVEVAGIGTEEVRTYRLGEDRDHLAIVRQCFPIDASCPGAAIFVIEVPEYAVPLGFTPVEPSRLLDTRPAGETTDGVSQRGGRAAAGSVTEFSIRDRGGISNLADTALLNITAVNPSAGGFLTVFGCDVDQPTASNLNFTTGTTRANTVVVEAAADGRVCVFTSAETHLIADANGFAVRGLGATAVTPKRYLDTRDADTFDGLFRNGGRVRAGGTIEVQVAGRGNIDSFIDTVLLNVTAVNPSAAGFLSVYPCGALLPNASNLNFEAGQTVANATLTRLGELGTVCVFSSVETHVLVDVNGLDQFGVTFSVTPARLFDSRGGGETVDGLQQGGGRIPAGSVTELEVRGRGVVDDSAQSVFLNVTAIRPTIGTFLTVYPCDIPRPNASNVNAAIGSVTPNAVFTAVSADGKVCIYNEQATDLAVDIGGFVPELLGLVG